MSREVVNYEKIFNFPFEGLVFIPCYTDGKSIEGASSIHYKDGEFVSFPFDKNIDDIKVFKNYMMKYK